MRLPACSPASLWPFLCALVACQPMAGGAGPSLPALPEEPRAAPGPVVESFHDIAVADPFRWLERQGERRNDWVNGQAEAGRRWLDRLPQRARVSEAIQRYQSIAGIQLLEQHGEHVYFFHNRGSTDQSDLYRLRTDALHQWSCLSAARCDRLPAGAERILAAADWPADRVLLSVTISPDGQRVAWLEQAVENGTHQWFWKRAGSPDGEVVQGDREPAVDLLWTHDSRGWYTIRSGEAGDRLEQLAADDDAGAAEVCPLESGTTIEQLQRIEGGSGELLLRVIPPGAAPQLMLCDVESESLLPLDQGTLVDPRYLGSRAGWHYFMHRRPDWRGEVVALARSGAGRVEERSVVAAAEHRLVDAVLTSAPQDPALWLHYREGGRSVAAFHGGRQNPELRMVSRDDLSVAARIEGMIHIGGSAAEADPGALYLTASGPATAPHVVRLREETAGIETLWSAQPPAEMESFVVRRHEVDTGAGRAVPLYVAGDAAVLDSGRPVPLVLEAYGGFDVPVDLRFSPSRAAWMALGGVYAVAGVRGGGDHGQDWYLAGRGAGKLDSIHDLETVMAWLIGQGITAPERLALRGYSQGATLAAAVAARGEQPVQALLASAGVMDLLRYPLYGAGSTWLAEYGDPGTTAGFEALRQYSPYHRVVQMAVRGGRHPLTLVMTRDEDPVVAPLHSYKYLAALRQAGVPALLRLERGATHAGTAPVDVLQQRHVDQWALLLAALRP